MKIIKNADYDYASNGITETNGYIKWYDWNIVRKHTRIINTIITTIFIIFAFSVRQSLANCFAVKVHDFAKANRQ